MLYKKLQRICHIAAINNKYEKQLASITDRTNFASNMIRIKIYG